MDEGREAKGRERREVGRRKRNEKDKLLLNNGHG